jgi:hypothetical protein
LRAGIYIKIEDKDLGSELRIGTRFEGGNEIENKKKNKDRGRD